MMNLTPIDIKSSVYITVLVMSTMIFTVRKFKKCHMDPITAHNDIVKKGDETYAV